MVEVSGKIDGKLDLDLSSVGVWLGGAQPSGWRMLADLPLVVLVGVTATGKSTVLRTLTGLDLAYTLLPDRRTLTNLVMIAPLRQGTQDQNRPLGRVDRYPYLRRFLQEHPGAMGDILASMSVAPSMPVPLLFESLRGVNEVQAAATALPSARFIMLHAPDAVRIQRLLNRADPHDAVENSSPAPLPEGAPLSFAALGVPGATNLVTLAQERELCAHVSSGSIAATTLVTTLRIILEERTLFNPDLTLAALRSLASDRLLVIDTASIMPDQVARACMEWLGGSYRT